jgi:diguanylate cyclase (GGDEF)-like protein
MAIGLLGGKLMKETWGKMGEALEAIDRLRKTSEPPPQASEHKAVNDIDRIPAVVNHLVGIARKQRVRLREHTEQLQALNGKIKEAKEQLQKAVREDWLTGLYNRRYFGELLVKEVERARRYGRQLALAMMEPHSVGDSDDSDGGRARDEALVAVAKATRNAIRQIDIPSRYGSERFAILFPETTVEKACVALDRIKAAAETHRLQGKSSECKAKLAVNVGVVMLCDDHRGPDDFVASADEALYEAKSRGRNETVVYTPSRVTLRAPAAG